MRKPIIAGNWKMHKTLGEAVELVRGIKRELYALAEVDIVVCPPYTALIEVNELLVDTNIKLGAQNMCWEECGAYTGEVSPLMLKDIGCQYVIIGHSERRQIFSESNENVNRKVKSALKHDLIPIMCVGERLEEREKGITFEVVRAHVEGGLKDLREEEAVRCIIAYEPVWAIGTGKTATPGQAEEVHAFIRNLLRALYNERAASIIRIQYGGSVRPDNIAQLMSEEDIDGALVGGASLKSDSFVELIKKCLPS